MNLDEPEDATHEFYEADHPFFATADKVDFDKIPAFSQSYGIGHDVIAYSKLKPIDAKYVLDLGSGSGRITLPLAQNTKKTIGIDISQTLLDRLNSRANALGYNQVQTINQDITELKADKNADMITISFNVLNHITDFHKQCLCLMKASEHLKNGGLLVLDLINPHASTQPVSSPALLFSSMTEKGQRYSRFVTTTAADVNQKQHIHGWYDVFEKDNSIKRYTYDYYFRHIYVFELKLMLEKAGLQIENVWGSMQFEPYNKSSKRLFVTAIKL